MTDEEIASEAFSVLADTGMTPWIASERSSMFRSIALWGNYWLRQRKVVHDVH